MAFAILLLESSKSNFYSSWKGDKNSFWNSENGILSNFFLNEKSKTELTINKFLNESRNFRKVIDIARPIIYERVRERERKRRIVERGYRSHRSEDSGEEVVLHKICIPPYRKRDKGVNIVGK